MSVASHARQRIAPLLIIVFLVVSLLIVLAAIGRGEDIRRKAAVPQGPATLILLPSGGAIAAGTKASVSFAATIQDLVVDGVQLVAHVTGTIPADLAYNPAAISGLRLVTSALEEAEGGKKLKLAYVTQEPQSPYSYSGTFSLGSLAFTAPDAGTLKVNFDTALSKIIQNEKQEDILSFPASAQYSFYPQPTATPTPAPTTTPTPPAGNKAPQFVTTSLVAWRVGKSSSSAITASDANGDSMTMTMQAVSPQAPWLSLGGCTQSKARRGGANQITCQLLGTPDAIGTYAVTLTVSDKYAAKISKDYTLTVTGKRRRGETLPP